MSKKLITALATAMEEAEQVAGSTGPEKKAYAVQAIRAIAARSLSFDEAILVGDLAPHLVDLVVAASKGLVRVNEREASCFSKSCALL
jgi:hypothetical protein